MLAGDTKALDGLLDRRLQFSHANGAVNDKQAYLAKMTTGRISYLAIDWGEPQVTILGDAALLAGRMTTRVRVDGTEKRLENRVLTVWIREGEWRLLAFQSTPIVK